MGKALFVIDMPENCNDCIFFKNKDGFTCMAARKYISAEFDINKKPDWCPLVEVPQKKDIRNANTMTDLGWIEGFNAFLDYILKRESRQ